MFNRRACHGGAGAASRRSGLCLNLAALSHKSQRALSRLVGVLSIASAVFGYQLYQERQKIPGIEISVGRTGILVSKKSFFATRQQ